MAAGILLKTNVKATIFCHYWPTTTFEQRLVHGRLSICLHAPIVEVIMMRLCGGL
jgi:hypothetical protein